MLKLLKYIWLIVVFTSCKKEVVVFNNDVNPSYELSFVLKLNNKNCVYDNETKTLKYSLSNNDTNQFTPLIEFQNYSSIKFNGQSLVNNSLNNLGDIELNREYSVLITSAGEENELKLKFTNIPLVQIITQDNIRNEPKILGKIYCLYPNQSKPYEESWMGIEIRGASTASLDKKSYGIKLFSDKYLSNSRLLSFFNMKENNEWILDAMYIDRSRARNKTSFELWRKITRDSTNKGIKSQFVEVYHNYKSLGLYCFNESYNEQFLNLNSQSVLISGVDNTNETKFNSLPQGNPRGRFWGQWEQKYPNPSYTLNWENFKSLNELVVNGSDTDFKNNINQLLDINNTIDYFLFVNMCNGYDNIGKNWFFFKKDNSAKFQILPWDLDATWGRNSQGELLNTTTLVTNGLFNRLINLNPSNFKSKLKNRWLYLRANSLSESDVKNLFTSNLSVLTDFNILEIENRVWNGSLNLNAEQIYIEGWITARMFFLDNYFSNL